MTWEAFLTLFLIVATLMLYSSIIPACLIIFIYAIFFFTSITNFVVFIFAGNKFLPWIWDIPDTFLFVVSDTITQPYLSLKLNGSDVWFVILYFVLIRKIIWLICRNNHYIYYGHCIQTTLFVCVHPLTKKWIFTYNNNTCYWKYFINKNSDSSCIQSCHVNLVENMPVKNSDPVILDVKTYEVELSK